MTQGLWVDAQSARGAGYYCALAARKYIGI